MAARAFERDAAEALIDALHQLGVEARRVDGGAEDLLVEAGGAIFIVEVKAVVTAADGARLVQVAANREQATVVVADRIAEAASSCFDRQAWVSMTAEVSCGYCALRS